MDYYIVTVPTTSGVISTSWRVQDNSAVRLGIPNARNSDGCHCEASDSETIFDAIRRLFEKSKPTGDCLFYRLNLDPGQYHPRMARPCDQHSAESPGNNPGELLHKDFLAVALGQLNVLTRQLDNICQTTHPTEKTFDTYGHAIRNLLILASTEVEMHLRGILVENGFIKNNYNTLDYFKLRDVMRLNEFSVRFPNYPWLEPVAPFQDWKFPNTSASLPWYDAYNAVKHNREQEFERATLRHAFGAVSACAVLLAAQFGVHFSGWRASESERFFDFDRFPKWTPSDVYTLPYQDSPKFPYDFIWTPLRYPFDAA